MNCWIILLLLSCCGRNNAAFVDNNGCGCDCHAHHEHGDNSFIQPRMWERDNCNCSVSRESDCDDYDHNHNHNHDNDGCDFAGEERVREKWMPYKDYNDNDRRDCNCK